MGEFLEVLLEYLHDETDGYGYLFLAVPGLGNKLHCTS